MQKTSETRHTAWIKQGERGTGRLLPPERETTLRTPPIKPGMAEGCLG